MVIHLRFQLLYMNYNHSRTSFKKERVTTKDSSDSVKKDYDGDNFMLPDKYLLNITIEELQNKGIKTLGLLGTVSCMEDIDYQKQIVEMYKVKLITPEKHDRLIIDDIILRETNHSILKPFSNVMYSRIVNKLINQGADAIIISNCKLKKIIDPSNVDVMFLYPIDIENTLN